MHTAIGVSDHIGWAELVTVRLQERAFQVVDRRRRELIAPGLPSAPYHHESLELPLGEAELLVARVRQSVAERCFRVIAELEDEFSAAAVVLQQSPYEQLPESLAEVLRSRKLTCAADGMLYRETLAQKAGELGLTVARYPRKTDRIAAAARCLGEDERSIKALIQRMGDALGPPWRKEHQQAAAAAVCWLTGQSG